MSAFRWERTNTFGSTPVKASHAVYTQEQVRYSCGHSKDGELNSARGTLRRARIIGVEVVRNNSWRLKSPPTSVESAI